MRGAVDEGSWWPCRCSLAPRAGSTGTGAARSTLTGLPAARWLEHYADTLPHRREQRHLLPPGRPGDFRRLARPGRPPGFVMAIKASRYLDPRPAASRARRAGRAPARRGRRPRRPARPGAAPAAAHPAVPIRPRWRSACGEFARQSAALAADQARPASASSSGIHPGETAEIRQILARPQRRAVLVRPPRPTARARCGAPPTGATCASTRAPRSRGRATDGRPCARGSRRIADTFPPESDVFAYFNNDQHAAAPADAEALVSLADRSRLARRAPGAG